MQITNNNCNKPAYFQHPNWTGKFLQVMTLYLWVWDEKISKGNFGNKVGGMMDTNVVSHIWVH